MKRTYLHALHAMQAGVGMLMNHRPSETGPKQLRVGVNSAMVETSAIVHLLIAKRIITRGEWETKLTEEMNAEADDYERELEEIIGTKVTLL